MSKSVALYEAVTGLFETVGRFLGRRADTSGPKFTGKFGSPQFFQSVYAKNEAAMNTLKSKGYGHVWKVPALRSRIEKESIRNSQRTAFGKLVPRGILTGSAMKGLDRARANVSGTALKIGLAGGAVVGIFSMATAPKGKMAEAATKNIGMTVGGTVGAAVGAGLLGFPGEIIGGFVGGSVGEKVGAAIAPLEEIGRAARHANFGGKYEDSEPAFSMRQRAVQEMGSSILNARQWLGKEASLLHQ